MAIQFAHKPDSGNRSEYNVTKKDINHDDNVTIDKRQ